MAAESYWRAVVAQAFQETWSALLESPMQIILALLSTAFGISLLFLVGDDHAARAEAIVRTSSGFILLLAFPLLFIVKLASIPVRREKHLTDAIESLQKTSLTVSRIEL